MYRCERSLTCQTEHLLQSYEICGCMDTPFGTTERRRFMFFVMACGYIAGAVMVRAVGTTSQTVEFLTLPGELYRGIRDLLDSFAGATSVEPTVILLLYVVSGIVLLTLAAYLLDRFAFQHQSYLGDEGGGFVPHVVLIYVLVGGLILFVLLLASGLQADQPQGLEGGVFRAAFDFVLGAAPQFLSTAIVVGLLALITVYVP